jgi:hypothetical protein
MDFVLVANSFGSAVRANQNAINASSDFDANSFSGAARVTQNVSDERYI